MSEPHVENDSSHEYFYRSYIALITVYKSFALIFSAYKTFLYDGQYRGRVWKAFLYEILLFFVVIFGTGIFSPNLSDFYMLSLVLVFSTPIFGLIIEISREEYCSPQNSQLTNNWMTRTKVGVEIFIVVALFIYIGSSIIGILFGPIIQLIYNLLVGGEDIIGETIFTSDSLYVFFTSTLAYYPLGAIIRNYFYRNSLSDLSPIGEYSGVLFDSEYMVLGIAIVLISPINIFFQNLMLGFLLTLNFGTGFENSIIRLLSVTVSLFAGVSALFLPFFIVAIGAPSTQVLSTENRRRCKLTKQMSLSYFHEK